jgi:hypothetical protein
MITIWMRLVYSIVPNQTRHPRKEKIVKCKIQKDCLTLEFVVNTIGTNELKLVIINKSLCPRCFGK